MSMIYRKINNYQQNKERKIRETQKELKMFKREFKENEGSVKNLLHSMSVIFNRAKERIMKAVITSHEDIVECKTNLEMLRSNTVIEIQEIRAYLAEFGRYKLTLARRFQGLQNNIIKIANEHKNFKITISEDLINCSNQISQYKKSILPKIRDIKPLINLLKRKNDGIKRDVKYFTNFVIHRALISIPNAVNVYKISMKQKIEKIKLGFQVEKKLIIKEIDTCKKRFKELNARMIMKTMKLFRNDIEFIKKNHSDYRDEFLQSLNGMSLFCVNNIENHNGFELLVNDQRNIISELEQKLKNSNQINRELTYREKSSNNKMKIIIRKLKAYIFVMINETQNFKYFHEEFREWTNINIIRVLEKKLALSMPTNF